LAVVKLRKHDKETLEKLASSISKVKGHTSNSEVVSLSLSFARSNIDRFLDGILKDEENEPLIQMLRKPARKGERTDARKIEEYLYDH
jgi:translation initiation factor RLI1